MVESSCSWLQLSVVELLTSISYPAACFSEKSVDMIQHSVINFLMNARNDIANTES